MRLPPLFELETLDDEPQPTGPNRFLSTIDILLPPASRLDNYPKNPHDFVRQALGLQFWEAQDEILDSVWNNQMTSVASCHGIGKSTGSAAIALTWLHSFENSLVLSTAPTGRQVEHILWRNIRTQWKRARIPLLGRQPLTTRYDIAEDWYAIGFKPTDTDTDPAQGFHADHVLVIIDEAAGVVPLIIDGMMAALTTEGSRLLMVGNPTSTSGPFYDSHHSQRNLYNSLNYSWLDTPNYKAGKTVHKWMITYSWVKTVIAKYGEQSPYVRSRVFAEWVSPEDVLIPLAQIETAKQRSWLELQEEAPHEAGLDVSRGGQDQTVLTLRQGARVMGSFEIPGVESPEVVGNVLDVLRQEQPGTTAIKIDVIGIGAAVYDTMKLFAEQSTDFRNLDIIPVNFSKVAWDPEKYKNQRCEAYGLLADRFRTGQIGGKIVDGVVGDLTEIRYDFDGRHTQPVIEPKEDFRERTGHSPDHGDSIALAFYTPPPDEVKPIGALAFGYANTKWGRL